MLHHPKATTATTHGYRPIARGPLLQALAIGPLLQALATGPGYRPSATPPWLRGHCRRPAPVTLPDHDPRPGPGAAADARSWGPGGPPVHAGTAAREEKVPGHGLHGPAPSPPAGEQGRWTGSDPVTEVLHRDCGGGCASRTHEDSRSPTAPYDTTSSQHRRRAGSVIKIQPVCHVLGTPPGRPRRQPQRRLGVASPSTCRSGWCSRGDEHPTAFSTTTARGQLRAGHRDGDGAAARA